MEKLLVSSQCNKGLDKTKQNSEVNALELKKELDELISAGLTLSKHQNI